MAHFVTYDTDAKSAQGFVGAGLGGSGFWNPVPAGDKEPLSSTEKAPYPEIKKGKEWTSQPCQTDFAEFISGQVETEKEGTIFIEQSFDYPQDHENETKALEESHWVPVETNKEGEQLKEGVKVKNGKPVTFVVFATAPYFRLKWVQGTEDNKVLRIFARAQEKGRV